MRKRKNKWNNTCWARTRAYSTKYQYRRTKGALRIHSRREKIQVRKFNIKIYSSHNSQILILNFLKGTGQPSSTKRTKKRDGKAKQTKPNDNHSSQHSTTEIISTSSGEQPKKTTQPDSGRESPTFLIQQLREVRRSLLLVSPFAFSNGFFSIASATVSGPSISLELRSDLSSKK